MGNAKRRHFIPKVYLKQWDKERRKPVELYVYDYINDYFVVRKSSKKANDNIIHLNDRLFYVDNLYTNNFESELNLIENNYEVSLNKIVQFSNINKGKSTKEVTKRAFEVGFFDTINYFINFAFIQWIRHPVVSIENFSSKKELTTEIYQNRIILFDFFRELLLKEDCAFFDMFTESRFELMGRSIYAGEIEDKNVYRYAIQLRDRDKISNIFNSNYKIIIAYSSKGGFVTTTKPIVPLFKSVTNKPFGIVFALSPNIALHILDKSMADRKMNSTSVDIIYSTNKSIHNVNKLICFNNPGALIVAGSKHEALKTFKGLRRKDIIDHCQIIKDKSAALIEEKMERLIIVSTGDSHEDQY